MQTTIPLSGFGGGGGSGGTLTVTAPEGVSVTVTKGGNSKTKTAGSDGTAVFKGLSSGVWTVTFDGARAKTVTITADYAVEYVLNLYRDGNTLDAVTGGIIAKPYVPSSVSSSAEKDTPTVTFGSETVTVETAKSGTAYIWYPISVTDYNSLCLTVTAVTNPSSKYIRLGVTDTKADGFTFLVSAQISSAGTYTVDISGLSGSKYIILSLYGAGSKSVTVSRWWLE